MANEFTDHESILLLTKAVDNLGKRLDEKLLELKTDIRELKDNYANRLGNAEQRLIDLDKVKVAKEEQDTINNELRCDIDTLKSWRWYLVGASAFSVPVLIYLAIKFFEHITK